MTRDQIMQLDAEGIERRRAQIREEMDAPNADLTALTQEVDALEERAAQLRTAREQREALERRIAGGAGVTLRTFVQENRERAEEDGPASKAYRCAWLKTIAVRSEGTRQVSMLGELTESERRAYMHTTANTGAVVPHETMNKIINLIESRAPMLADAMRSNMVSGFSVPRARAITVGDAKGVEEGTANVDEETTFDMISLDGIEIKKHVVITRKMSWQSIDAFEAWLTQHLADRIMVAKERQIRARLSGEAPEGGNVAANAGIDSDNILIDQTYTDETIAKIMSMIKGNGEKVVYANGTTIWSKLALIKDGDGRKLFVPNSMGDPTVQGRIYGAPVKQDDEIPANVVYFGVKGQVLANDFEALFIHSAIEPKTLNNVITAYALFDSALQNPKAFVKATFTEE
ncbi:MAG: phage major capsid protein [Clostridia bacterium]|nr:phage major capsid protein [Clostridia bacterium]